MTATSVSDCSSELAACDLVAVARPEFRLDVRCSDVGDGWFAAKCCVSDVSYLPLVFAKYHLPTVHAWHWQLCFYCCA